MFEKEPIVDSHGKSSFHIKQMEFKYPAARIGIASRRSIFDYLNSGHDNIAVVSITNPDFEFVNLVMHASVHSVTRLKFDDMDDANYCAWPINSREPVLFDVGMANQIWEFTDRHLCSGYKNILVQCDGGVSRSSAVAAALHQVYNADSNVVFSDNRYIPNTRVFRIMLEQKGIKLERRVEYDG